MAGFYKPFTRVARTANVVIDVVAGAADLAVVAPMQYGAEKGWGLLKKAGRVVGRKRDEYRMHKLEKEQLAALKKQHEEAKARREELEHHLDVGVCIDEDKYRSVMRLESALERAINVRLGVVY